MTKFELVIPELELELFRTRNLQPQLTSFQNFVEKHKDVSQ